jgi:hypothetical protein
MGTITIPRELYSNLLSCRFTSEFLLKYLDKDILEYNRLNDIDYKYLKRRMNRLEEDLNNIKKNESEIFEIIT